ncbi:MAG: class II fructose-bisphosphate aldolase [Anaerolineae bacterium]|nr:class II fructose-bisphosphate aldolase [Anaerolineae bacterium]
MTYITRREEALAVHQRFRKRGVCLALFCTASHWNTEAVLLAAQRFARRHSLEEIPISVAMTYNYPYMPQAQRITYSRDPVAGFMSNVGHLRALCDGPDTPYTDVMVLPHLDHGQPDLCRWALTEGLPHLATVMFDTEKYPYEENVRLTREYVEAYGDRVMVEGVIEQLAVGGAHGKAAEQSDAYIDRALDFVAKTGVDLLVADLGTEQQADKAGGAVYLRARARALTEVLGEPRLVLHGTSSLSEADFRGLAADGVIRINMWTRIAREAGQHAARQVVARRDAIEAGDFEATESRQYLYDSIEAAADIMEGVLELIGYAKLGGE